MRYDGKVTLVTGGSKGIGEGCVRVFAGAGAKVVFCARSRAAGEALAAEATAKGPGQASFVPCDVSKVDEVRAFVDEAAARHGRIDCLINNAGWHPPHKPIDDFSVEEFRALLELNLVSMFAACQRWFKVAREPAKLARVLKKEYPDIKRISIDYALMEHAQNVICANGDFEWDDLGAWTALARHLKADPEGNCAVADFVHVDAARNIVYDARTRNRTPIAIVGLRDSIIVQTDDVTMVAHKTQAQKIKEMVRKLAADKRLQKLV